MRTAIDLNADCDQPELLSTRNHRMTENIHEKVEKYAPAISEGMRATVGMQHGSRVREEGA